MHRLSGAGYRTAIDTAIDLIPKRIAKRFEAVDFLTDVDPAKAGLHFYKSHAYDQVPHTVHTFHQLHFPKDKRQITIVLPLLVEPRTVIHEFGHVLDEQFGFSHDVQPCTEYAKTDRWEAFAEAFMEWVMGCSCIYEADPKIISFFERMKLEG